MQACIYAASNFVHADTCLAAIGSGDVSAYAVVYFAGAFILGLAVKYLG